MYDGAACWWMDSAQVPNGADMFVRVGVDELLYLARSHVHNGNASIETGTTVTVSWIATCLLIYIWSWRNL